MTLTDPHSTQPLREQMTQWSAAELQQHYRDA